MVPNKPNSQRTGLRRALPDWAGAQLCGTKPICPALARRGAGRQDRNRCRRWGRVCETNPIAPEWRDGQVLYGKRVMTNLARQRLRKNKASLHRSVKFEVSSSKSENRASSPSSLMTSDFRWAVEWLQCERAEDAGASAPNKANLATGLGEVRQDARAAGGISCTNKANLADRNRDRRAKQSQFGRSNGKRQVRCGKRFMTNWTRPGA